MNSPVLPPTHFYRLATVVGALLLFNPAGFAVNAAAAPAPGVFLEAPAQADLAPNPLIQRHRAVRINFESVKPTLARGDILPFNLFTDTSFTGVVEAVERRSDSDYTVMGRLQGDADSRFALVVNQNVMVMDLRTGKASLMEVRYLGDGLHDVRQIDPGQYPTCGNGAEQSIAVPKAARAADAGPQADAGDTIDVMVVYTPAARVAAGGTAAIEALINLAVAQSNTNYQQSLVTPRIRLVYKAEVSYTESGFSTDLDRLTNPSDGYMDEVQAWRNTYGADLVSLWINDASSCGLAWLMTTVSSTFESYGFSTVHWDCAVGNFSFIHEMGHNMGCAHDRENAGGPGAYSYSYGWRFYGVDSIQYRTIMAYAPGSRIGYFSNPNVNYQGTPTGKPVGDANESYNTLTINNTANTVANFRQTVVSTNQPPSISVQPAPVNVPLGSNATFWVVASGSTPLAHQWRKNGSPIAGATLSNYTIVNVQASNAANYSVVITNNYGSVTSSAAALTINFTVSLGDGLDAPQLTWTSGGSNVWSGLTNVSHDGVDSAQSGTITDDQDSWLQTTVVGPTTLTFWWKVSSESGYDTLRFTVNGVEQFNISGEVDWQQRSVALSSGSQTLRWRYVKDASVSVGQDRGWVDQVAYVPPATLASALDNPGLVWNTSGNANWFPQTNVTHDGLDAAQSGTITDLEESDVSTTVVGPCKVSYWWKVSSEQGYDVLGLWVDSGLYPTNFITGEIDWTQASVSLPAGSHLLEWVYLKDESYGAGQDRGWLDQVVLTVAPGPVLGSFNGGSPPQFQLQFTGALGGSYTVLASTNLLNWSALTNLVNTGSAMSVTDTSSTNFPRRFYRVQSP
jgi:peptidyl-Asp metalloendopeptidase